MFQYRRDYCLICCFRTVKFYHYLAEEFKLVKYPRDFRSDPAKLVGLTLLAILNQNSFRSRKQQISQPLQMLFVVFVCCLSPIYLIFNLKNQYYDAVASLGSCQAFIRRSSELHSLCQLFSVVTTTYFISNQIFHFIKDHKV